MAHSRAGQAKPRTRKPIGSPTQVAGTRVPGHLLLHQQETDQEAEQPRLKLVLLQAAGMTGGSSTQHVMMPNSEMLYVQAVENQCRTQNI